MSMYKEAYYILNNSITKVIKKIEKGNNKDKEKLLEEVCMELKEAQETTEEMILSSSEEI